MASPRTITVATSPKTGQGEATSSPKGQPQCLCSPTTHQGSFRCRFHRSLSSTWMRRSKSMPVNAPATSISPKSVETS